MDILEQAAIVAHEANRVWCQLNGDDSQPVWDDAPDWQKDSARNGVEFHLQNPMAGDDASHNNWMQHKIDEGWHYGETKDPEAKTHPCLVPFHALPFEQRVKDALFRHIVHAILGLETNVRPVVTDVQFNPSGNPAITAIKMQANKLGMVIEDQVEPGRRRSVALTKLEDAAMWAVKSAAVGDS